MTPDIYQRPAELLQRLIQFDTTNPPGNETEIIAFINKLLTEAGLSTQILAKAPHRPNLIARLKGRGEAPPLLLQGHVDVVTTKGQHWQVPPFEGRIADGYVWGRGALDMKGGVVMMLSSLLRAKVEGLTPPGDIILAILADEEAGSDMGAKFLVEEHPELFEGVRYAIGEFGGFTFYVGDQRFYPIQVAEKQICWMKATVRGPAGHGSRPIRGGAMARLGEMLLKLDRHRLAVHITPVPRQMFETMADALGGVTGVALRGLLSPRLADRIIDLLGERGRLFDAMLHNTVSPTIVRGGDKINVILSEVTVELDGRLLPGQTPEDMLRELHAILGDDVQLEVLRHDPGPPEPDMGWFDVLAAILRELDPEGVPTSLLQVGVTDARFFARLGIQTYGFLPLKLPTDFDFASTIHAANERVPVEAIEFGAEALYRAIQRMPKA
ncbi:MAG TPA: M20/M25/M40 family metallo-hydrolase [Caldilineales bacterium]|nr:M20/M25/M40 family metallo-hydrolase [Caldilineales bacterium]